MVYKTLAGQILSLVKNFSLKYKEKISCSPVDEYTQVIYFFKRTQVAEERRGPQSMTKPGLEKARMLYSVTCEM